MNIVSKSLGTGLPHLVPPEQLDVIEVKTNGFSGGDVKEICKDAVRKIVKRCAPVVTKKLKMELNKDKSQSLECHNLFPGYISVNILQSLVITAADFEAALQERKPSVDRTELQSYVEWNNKFGTGSM